MKNKIGIIVIIASIIVAVLYYGIERQKPLTEAAALKLLFHNYDVKNKQSMWKNMTFPNNEDLSPWKAQSGIVKCIFISSFIENKVHKYILLTKTIPNGEPYVCHACLPLLSAFIFVKNHGNWMLDSANYFMMQEGEYGESPDIKLMKIGRNKFGLIVQFEHVNGEFRDKRISILIPYGKIFKRSLDIITYYNNFSSCGLSIQCSAYTAMIDFDSSKNATVYPVIVTRYGTENDENLSYKSAPVDDKLIYQYSNGKYTRIAYRGFPKIK